jgi:dimethylaniline monooxygenase (N-oxide forming)
MDNQVAVIGAGVSGIVAAKTLLEYGFTPVVFEKRHEIGGVWHYNPNVPNGDSPCYASLHTNTSKYSYAFSDMPLDEDIPDYPHHSHIFDYLCSYTNHFQLRQYIQFDTKVQSVRREDKGWKIVTEHDGETKTRHFGRVIVCSGRYQDPHIPKFAGQETFTGKIIHSMDYSVPEPYNGKRVVVVGAAASAVDIAAELGQHAEKVIMAAQQFGIYFPNTNRGRPADFTANRLTLNLPNFLLSSVIVSILRKSYEALQVDFEKFPWYTTEKLDLNKMRGAVNTAIIHSINDGTVTPRKMFTHIEGSNVVFPDGSRETVDAIILGTGFDIKYPFLPDKMFDSVAGDIGLYLHIFYPPDSTIAFTGTTAGAGAFPPVAELQARRVCAAWGGDYPLPTLSKMQKSVSQRQKSVENGETRPMFVSLAAYSLSVAKQIGAAPNLWKQRVLLKPLLLGPIVAAHYRLNTP